MLIIPYWRLGRRPFRAPASSGQSRLVADAECFRERLCAEPIHEARAVHFRRARADIEVASNALARAASHDRQQRLALARGETGDGRPLGDRTLL